MDVPTGFRPIFRSSPFLDAIGPIYSSGDGSDMSVGLRVAEKHCNARGNVHGGVLATLCDVGLGYAMAFGSKPPMSLVTTSLHIDFAATAVVGDWIQSRTDIHQKGKRLAFANCYLLVNERRIAHASGVYLVVGALPA